MKNNQISIFKNSFLAISIALFTLACKEEPIQTLSDKNWELSWSDEFNGDAGSLPDSNKWNFDIGTGNGGWGNNELQYYTNKPENVAHDGNGNLVITARKENFGTAAYTSARIKTKGLFDQKYGRFEARLKTPYGPGLWPAFWMLGNNVDEVSWPNCGEIDIMELRGQEPHIINGTLHGPGYSAGNSITKPYALKNGRYDTNFHVFAIEWTDNQIDFFVDDFLYQRLKPSDLKGNWVYDHPFFMIFNVAVGGNYVGFPTSGTVFPQKLTIDYVRVYKEK